MPESQLAPLMTLAITHLRSCQVDVSAFLVTCVLESARLSDCLVNFQHEVPALRRVTALPHSPICISSRDALLMSIDPECATVQGKKLGDVRVWPVDRRRDSIARTQDAFAKQYVQIMTVVEWQCAARRENEKRSTQVLCRQYDRKRVKHANQKDGATEATPKLHIA